MAFSVKNKVALITGGASGIGFGIAKKLLKNGAKGVTLADMNEELGHKALQEMQSTFGDGKAIFVRTDVRDIDQFEDAFLKTINTFKQVDILINNAGILDDSQWNNEIDINVKGTINGTLLGLEKYLQANRSGNEGVIVNLCSTAGVSGFVSIPVYTSTKFAIHGMTLAWGAQPHYDRTKVKVVAICPGATITNMLASMSGKNLGAPYEEYRLKYEAEVPVQTVEQCAIGTIQVIEHAKTGTVWVLEGNETPYQYIIPDRTKLTEKIYITS